MRGSPPSTALRSKRLLPLIAGLTLALGPTDPGEAGPRRYERPTDPYFQHQWSLENTGQPMPADNPGPPGAWDADIDATEAFAAGHTGRGVTVAIIGTGIRGDGGNLVPVLWENPREVKGNGEDDDTNGLVDDLYGWDFAGGDPSPSTNGRHDQAVAEIAVAPHDGRGLAGVAPEARLIVLKIADDQGRLKLEHLPRALSYALRYGARVILMPWSAKKRSCNDPEFLKLGHFIERAADHALIVAGTPGEWPACLPEVVSVRASRPDDRSQGMPASDVDFAAPGAYVGPKVFVSYAIGTVGGAAALLFAQDPSRTPADVREILARTADRVHPEVRPYRGGWNSLYGAGRINVSRALGTDFDKDGVLDADDPDADGDGIRDRDDACTLDANPLCGEEEAVSEPTDDSTEEQADGR